MGVLFVIVFLLGNVSISAQDTYQTTVQSLVDCGLRIYSKHFDVEAKRLVIQTDSFTSPDYAQITIEPWDRQIHTTDYDTVDATIQRRYANAMIISTQRTSQKYGIMYWYVIKNPHGNPYCDRYVIRVTDKKSILMIYRSLLGNNSKNFDTFECSIEK